MDLQDSNALQSFEAKRPRRRYGIWVIVALLWAFIIAWLYVSPPPEIVEQLYSRGLYRLVSMALVPLTNSIPTSLALFLLISLLSTWIVFWIAQIASRRRYFWGIKWLVIGGAFIGAAFILFWGAGYKRVPAAERLELGEKKLEETEVYEMQAEALALVKEHAPKEGAARDRTAAIAAISESMKEVLQEWEGSSATIPKAVKSTPPGLLLANGTSGVCAPFTLEPHVDGALPDTRFVSVAAHELGHIGGMCYEDEATLLGFAAGLACDNSYARYAVALDIYMDIFGMLPPAKREEAMKALPEVAREDLRKAQEISKRYRINWFRNLSWKAYDGYLKSQGIQEGIKNYDKGIVLLGLARRKGLISLTGKPAPAPAEANSAPAPESPEKTPSASPHTPPQESPAPPAAGG